MQNTGTKSLREVAADEIELESWKKKGANAVRKARDGVKNAGKKVGNAIKWLTSDNYEITEGIGDINYWNLENLINDEALEVAQLLNAPVQDIICISSKLNETKYTMFRKFLTSAHWSESCRSTICPEISALGKLICTKSGNRIDAVAGFYNDGAHTPCVSFFIKKQNYEDFVCLINKTYLT